MEDQRICDEGFGPYLARERTLRNIRLEEIAAKTRISLQVLRALESEDWDALPARVYVRGFIRAYARHVGLDENEVLLRYEDYMQSLDLLPALTRKKDRPFRHLRVCLALTILVLLFIMGYLAWWRPMQRSGISGEPAPSTDLLQTLPMPSPPPPKP
jgi:cytoskeleton protein RodZ